MEVLTLKQREDGVYDLPTDALMAAVDKRIESSKIAPLAQDGQAELEASGVGGIFQKIIDFKPMDVPVGAGIVGGTTAFLLTELSDYLLAKTANKTTGQPIVPTWVADGIMAVGAVMVAKKWKPIALAANLAAMFLVYEAVRGPVERQITKLLHRTTAPAAQHRSAVEQAEAVARARQLGQDPATTGDYYRTAFRRA